MFRRRSQTTPDVTAAVADTQPCSVTGCARRDGTRCGYVDKRARACPTAWCPEHAAFVGGLVFCRRHASTLVALDGAQAVAGMPDLDNRAPSLAGWVGRELDRPVRDLLTGLAGASDATVITEPVRLVMTPGGRTRRWAKVWKTLDSTAVLTRVSIEVDEDQDCEVAARVDTELIGRGVPPWIEHRLRGDVVDPDIDRSERREFLAAMARSIELVVTRQEVVPAH